MAGCKWEMEGKKEKPFQLMQGNVKMKSLL